MFRWLQYLDCGRDFVKHFNFNKSRYSSYHSPVLFNLARVEFIHKRILFTKNASMGERKAVYNITLNIGQSYSLLYLFSGKDTSPFLHCMRKKTQLPLLLSVQNTMMKDSQDLHEPTIGGLQRTILPACCLKYIVHTCCKTLSTLIPLTSDDPIAYAVSIKRPHSESKHKPNDKERFGTLRNNVYTALLVVLIYSLQNTKEWIDSVCIGIAPTHP